MGILTDWQIKIEKAISPFEPGIKREDTISYGVSSYGYDARVGYKFKIFTPALCAEIDPKNFDPKAFVDVDLTPKKHYCIDYPHEACEACSDPSPNFIRIPPNSFALAESMEEFTIPRDCLAIVLGKSTYARCGIIINVTPLEPEWRGKVTIEISNTTPLPARIYAGEGIMQVLFLRTDGIRQAMLDAMRGSKGLVDAHNLKNWLETASCKTSYADKKGKYQNQTGLTLPEVDK